MIVIMKSSSEIEDQTFLSLEEKELLKQSTNDPTIIKSYNSELESLKLKNEL